jgi:hypothetical protein
MRQQHACESARTCEQGGRVAGVAVERSALGHGLKHVQRRVVDEHRRRLQARQRRAVPPRRARRLRAQLAVVVLGAHAHRSRRRHAADATRHLCPVRVQRTILYASGGWACEEVLSAGQGHGGAPGEHTADRARTDACTRGRPRACLSRGASSASGAGAGAQASIARQWSDSSDTDAARPARHTPASAGLL